MKFLTWKDFVADGFPNNKGKRIVHAKYLYTRMLMKIKAPTEEFLTFIVGQFAAEKMQFVRGEHAIGPYRLVWDGGNLPEKITYEPYHNHYSIRGCKIQGVSEWANSEEQEYIAMVFKQLFFETQRKRTFEAAERRRKKEEDARNNMSAWLKEQMDDEL